MPHQTRSFDRLAIILHLSESCFNEIKRKLEDQGSICGPVIELSGVAVTMEKRPERETVEQFKQRSKSLVGLTIPERTT